MNPTDDAAIHPAVPMAFAVLLCVGIFFIGFVFFDVDKRMSYADFDAGSVGIVASSFFAMGFSMLAFQKIKHLVFYTSLAMFLLLLFLLYFYPVRETIRLDEYSSDFNWLLLAFIPCTILVGKGLRQKWYRVKAIDQ